MIIMKIWVIGNLFNQKELKHKFGIRQIYVIVAIRTVSETIQEAVVVVGFNPNSRFINATYSNFGNSVFLSTKLVSLTEWRFRIM